jgi:hypothetical protein
MGIRISAGRARIECEACHDTFESETEVMMDATAEARAAGWEERKTGFWFCEQCIVTARDLAKVSS